jgi:hypothetical protein
LARSGRKVKATRTAAPNGAVGGNGRIRRGMSAGFSQTSHEVGGAAKSPRDLSFQHETTQLIQADPPVKLTSNRDDVAGVPRAGGGSIHGPERGGPRGRDPRLPDTDVWAWAPPFARIIRREMADAQVASRLTRTSDLGPGERYYVTGRADRH